jgi:hypothetical protein
MRFDPFQKMDRLIGQVFGSARAAATMPMDLYRSGEHYVLQAPDLTRTAAAPPLDHAGRWITRCRPT